MTTPDSTPAATALHTSRGLARLIELAAAEPLQPPCDEFYFLRHGQTPRNALRIFQSYDEPLSDLGEQQAAAAAAALAGEPIRCIVSSDARRALHTAHTVAATLGLEPTLHAPLRERHFGALVGTSSADIDWDCAPEGGETLAQFVDRKRQALQAALATQGPVLIVAHGGSLYVLAALLNVPVDLSIMANAHPLHFTRQANGWQARSLMAPGACAPAGGLA
ncbi:MAG: histidine phosphatase family protein [Comamonadaceae bacterium]|nr:MAG: histidine phosphatase family protein [Comamonadaceae bacterium]